LSRSPTLTGAVALESAVRAIFVLDERSMQYFADL
jgi:hypothetical protein